MSRALIIYATRTGGTRRLAELIAEGIKQEGEEVEIKPVTAIKNPDDLKGYDAYAFGSATYHGDMIQGMKKVLFIAEKAGLNGKPGAAFGVYGWSGEAPKRIFETMQHIFGMKMVGTPIKLKAHQLSAADKAEIAMELGRKLAKSMKGENQ